MTAQEAYILAKAYTNKSIEGAGSLKGAACQIKSIEAITGGHRITFEWEDNDGEVSTDTMDVMDGADGDDGVGISSIAYKETDAHGNYIYTVTLTSGSTYDITCPKGAQGETGETGNGIASIEKTGTSGNVDTYTITYTNGQTSTFTVTNGVNPTVDDAMSESSTNPVQNKVITAALADKQDKTDNTLQTTSKTVAGAVNELKSGLTTLDTEVNGDATTYPYADVITIEDAIPANLAECKVKLEPVQDLHGQSAPYVGGAGKNKLPMTVDGIKAANTSGTWSGNTYTLNGVTFTVQMDNDGNVTGINVNGTATDSTYFDFVSVFNSSEFAGMIYNGSPSSSNVVVRVSGSDRVSIQELYNGYAIDDNGDNLKIAIRVGGTATINNEIFKPMLRLSTETDATFAPYTNICPISGHTESVVSQGDGINQWNEEWESGTYNAETGEKEDNPIIIRSKGYISILPSTKYCTVAGYMQIFFYDENYNYLGNITNGGTEGSIQPHEITTNANAHYMTFRLASQYGTTYNDNISINYPSTITTYHPYAGKTYTIALGDTIYGGTVRIDSSGNTVMDVDYVKKVFDGSEDESWTTRTSQSGYTLFEISLSDTRSSSAQTQVGLCNEFPWSIGFETDRSYRYYQTTIGIRYDGLTLAWLKEWLSSNELEVTLPLVTPTTIQLTPQQIQLLKGQNTLTASTGQISVTVNGVSGSIGAVQTQANDTDAALAELAADIAEQLPTAPTTDGAYVLTVTVADGTPIYSWESAT